MEESRQVPELVHVLRHSFRPSDQLGLALENFRPPESRRPVSPLEIKSLGMLALDGYSHANYAYSEQLIDARRAVEKSQGRSFTLTPEIEIRHVNENAIDILMGVEDKMAMFMLMRTTKNFLPEAIPLRDNVNRKFAVFTRIHSSVPIPNSFQDQALAEYHDAYKEFGPKNLMNILPEGIIGKSQHRPARRPVSQDDSA